MLGGVYVLPPLFGHNACGAVNARRISVFQFCPMARIICLFTSN